MKTITLFCIIVVAALETSCAHHYGFGSPGSRESALKAEQGYNRNDKSSDPAAAAAHRAQQEELKKK